MTSKCASRHNGVHFFDISTSTWLRTRRFSEPTFRPSGAPNHRKNTVFRDFPTFSRTCIFFFLFSDLLSSTLLFSLTLPISAFHLSILSEVWLLNFLRWCIYMCIYIYIHIHAISYLYNTKRHTMFVHLYACFIIYLLVVKRRISSINKPAAGKNNIANPQLGSAWYEVNSHHGITPSI